MTCHSVYNEQLNPWPYDSLVENTQCMYDDAMHHFGNVIMGAGFETLHELKEPDWQVPTPPPDEMDKCLQDVSKVPTDEWKHKNVRVWTPFDIMNWVIHEIKRKGQNYEEASMKSFRTTGEALYHMTKSEFEHCDPNFGSLLYDALQTLKNSSPPYNQISPLLPPFNNIRLVNDQSAAAEPVLTSLGDYVPNRHFGQLSSDAESESSQLGPERKRKPAGRVGRPPYSRSGRRKQEKKTGRLWEFIRDLLKNREYCPSLICWENYDEGVFRFVRSDKVAELWGTIKENPRMTYEKLSRAMRYYYKSKVLQPVLGRRLVYKFGPTATNWQTPNPNFRLPE